jgi:hypothetical protein
MCREQQLIDIMFDIALTVKYNFSHTTPNEVVCGWVARQLKMNGFPTVAIGSSWGILSKDKEK